jgi:hypothetical protein
MAELRFKVSADQILTWPLEDDVTTLGRNADNAIVIDNNYISVFHAEIIRLPDGKGYEVVDLGSYNGTKVNGGKIKRVRLQHGDIIHFGQLETDFVAKPAAEGAKQAPLHLPGLEPAAPEPARASAEMPKAARTAKPRADVPKVMPRPAVAAGVEDAHKVQRLLGICFLREALEGAVEGIGDGEKGGWIEDSTDLENWGIVESAIAGNGTVIQRFYSTRGTPKRYFRVEDETP